MREGLSRIIVNIEAQKDEPSEYHILNRGIFYGCRMISSQKEREFKKSDYNNIKQVYSIWICMNMEENSLNHIHLTNDSIMGSHEWNGDLDLLNIVFIRLTNKRPPQEEIYKLHRFLGSLFSTDCTIKQKITVLEDEYGIPAKGDIREEVKLMCNLSQGIREAGWKAGLSEGRAEGRTEGRAAGRVEGFTEIFSKMYKKGYTLEQIADIADKPVTEIETIIQSKKDLALNLK